MLKNMMFKRKPIFAALCLTFCLVLQTVNVPLVNAENGSDDIRKTSTNSYEEYISQIESYSGAVKYFDYQQQYLEWGYPDEEYIIDAQNYTKAENIQVNELVNYEGKDGVSVLTSEQGVIEWEVDIKQAGNYNIGVEYFPYEGKSSSIQRSVLIDGKLPFAEAGTVEFDRYWTNESDEIKTDKMGNDIRPRQVEKPVWSEEILSDSKGYYTAPFEFYLSKGKHTICFVGQREPLLIKSIKVFNSDDVLPYEKIFSQYKENGYKNSEAEPIRVEAEEAIAKSEPMLYGISDPSSPAIEPYSPSKVKINTIGGNNWKSVGQWIEWKVNVPESGLYRLALHAKQNFVRGVPVKRKVMIDGEVPFEEAEQLDFTYDNNWRVEVLGNDNPYMFYFEKGEHTIRLEAVLGDLSTYVRDVEDSLKNLNQIYHDIISITGTEADPYRDYQLTKKMPDLSNQLKQESNSLKEVVKGLKSITGKSSDKEAALNTMIQQLDMLSGDVEKVIPRLLDFKTNIGGLGTWLLQINETPLQLDALYVLPAEGALPKTNSSFMDKVWHEIRSLYYSFVVDYNSIGDVSDAETNRTITVWVGAGRDQANSLKSLIDETFTKETGIGVNLMLVQMDMLLQATLAGQGPDVAMQVANNLPMNYAMRGAVVNVAAFDDFNEITKRFNESALVPFRFENSCYALPETQTFPMMFYRKDILKEQGIEVPNTWNDVKAAISTLSRNNMTFGLIPTPDMGYGMFLYQMGGEFYTAGGKASALDSNIGVNAFKEWTKYYTDYTLEREFDFANRFRTGEMPLGIADYSMYNTLQVSAPEIQGLWEFTQVPGTVQENGDIDHSVPSGGQAVVIMEQSKDKQAAWEYLKWWTSAETQVKFGRELESLMGPSARYPTANMEALEMLPWPVRDYQNLKVQFKNVKGIPEVPGGYFTSRNMNNAFYKVVVSKSLGAREALMDQVRYINDEIKYKRQEFGLAN